MLGATAGILYGVSATLMKPVVEDLHRVGVSGVLESWEVWVMAIGGLVGFYLQRSPSRPGSWSRRSPPSRSRTRW